MNASIGGDSGQVTASISVMARDVRPGQEGSEGGKCKDKRGRGRVNARGGEIGRRHSALSSKVWGEEKKGTDKWCM